MPQKVAEKTGLDLETHIIRQCDKQLKKLPDAASRRRVADYLMASTVDAEHRERFAKEMGDHDPQQTKMMEGSDGF